MAKNNFISVLKLHEIELGDHLKTVAISLNLAQLKTLVNALCIDVAGDEAADIKPDAGKLALLERLEKFLPE